MITAPVALGLWAIATAWPSESHGHTISDQTRYQTLDACTAALPKAEAEARRIKSRGTPICVEVKQ